MSAFEKRIAEIRERVESESGELLRYGAGSHLRKQFISDVTLLLEMLELIENTPIMIQPEDLKVFVQKRDAIVKRHEGNR